MAAYKIKTDIFEGPFDLLLHLVGRQKLDIRDIPVAEIADEFCAHIEAMKDLDLDVASDFLLVAATLLEIKSAALFPGEDDAELDEYDDLSPEEARALLVERLLAYKQFKNAAGELANRLESEGRMHSRAAGLEPEFLTLMPDYLEGMTLRGLAVLCSGLDNRREIFLLQAEHIASMPIPLELHMESVRRSVAGSKRVRFSELITEGASNEIIVVTFLAVLELYKRGVIDVTQDVLFGDMVVSEHEEKDSDG
ncbi:MAG TPA: segregation/condensation protein A [Coriobacteriia bacterium]